MVDSIEIKAVQALLGVLLPYLAGRLAGRLRGNKGRQELRHSSEVPRLPRLKEVPTEPNDLVCIEGRVASLCRPWAPAAERFLGLGVLAKLARYLSPRWAWLRSVLLLLPSGSPVADRKQPVPGLGCDDVVVEVRQHSVNDAVPVQLCIRCVRCLAERLREAQMCMGEAHVVADYAVPCAHLVRITCMKAPALAAIDVIHNPSFTLSSISTVA